jgi:hypothetical protein
MNYPYVTFVQTAHNEKTLVLTFPTKEEALNWYQQLNNHNFCWYKNNKEEIIISLKVTDGSFLTIKLLNPIQFYRNFSWFLENKLTHITTDFEGSGIEAKILPTTLIQQIPCP